MAGWIAPVSRHSEVLQSDRRSDMPAGVLPARFRTKSRGVDALVPDEPSLAAMASLAVLELENVRLRGAEQRRRGQLEAIRAFLRAVPEPSLNAALDRIAEQAGAVLGGRTGWIWLWDPAGEVLVPRRRVGEPDAAFPDPVHLGEGLAGWVAEKRRGLVVNDYRAWPNRLPAFLARSGLTAAMAEPLASADRLLGVLALDNELSGDSFTAEEAQLLQIFAAHASLAIANAELAQQVQADRLHLQALSRRLVEAQETERRALARELHDEIGQSLTGLRLLLDLRGEPATSGHRLTHAQELAASLLGRVRQLCLDLRPGMLDDLGLVPALLWHIERYQAQTGIQVEFRHAEVEDRRFAPEVETAAYRVVQEALTNVARHADVPLVVVCIWRTEDLVGVQIEDAGVGFDPDARLRPASSTGLQGMRERVTLLGGRLTVDSAPGQGTCIVAELPLTGNTA